MLGLTLGGWLTMQVASCDRQPTSLQDEPPQAAIPALPLDQGALNPDNLRALQKLLTDPDYNSP